MKSITRPAHAKINLTLDVGARRPDGYHDIRSIMQTIALHDTLVVTHTPEKPGVFLDVTGDEAGGVPANETNLVHRAAVRLQKIAAARETLPGNRSGLHIALHKRIPSQAGLGGGSSDAAATLLAVNDLLGLALSLGRLSEIGASLGADVPFFLTGGTALVEGLGEKVTPLAPLSPPCSLVIVKPSLGVSTSAAYSALDALPERVPGRSTEAWLRGEKCRANDFEVVIVPRYHGIAVAHSALTWTAEDGECFRPLLCGSGSALFCMVPDTSAARELAAQVQGLNIGDIWITETCGAKL